MSSPLPRLRLSRWLTLGVPALIAVLAIGLGASTLGSGPHDGKPAKQGPPGSTVTVPVPKTPTTTVVRPAVPTPTRPQSRGPAPTAPSPSPSPPTTNPAPVPPSPSPTCTTLPVAGCVPILGGKS